MNEDENTESTLSNILDKLPPDKAVATAKAMMHYGVRDGDPTVTMIDIAIDTNAARQASTAAAQAAGDAAGSVKTETQKIPDLIYQSTIRAGADLRAVVGQEVRAAGTEVGQAVTAAIQSAATVGADALKQAASELPQRAKENQDDIIRGWKSLLAVAVRDEARGALARRMAGGWGMVVLSLLFASGVGAGGMWAAARMTGHLTPWSYPLALTPAGAPQCGLLRAVPGQRVCLVRP